MYPVWLWSLPQVALSQPSILAESWWEAAPSESRPAQTGTVSGVARHVRWIPQKKKKEQQNLFFIYLALSKASSLNFWLWNETVCSEEMQAGREQGKACFCWGSKMKWASIRGFDVSWQASGWQSDDLGEIFFSFLLAFCLVHPGLSRLTLQWQIF